MSVESGGCPFVKFSGTFEAGFPFQIRCQPRQVEAIQ
jgi:hypothetical protein